MYTMVVNIIPVHKKRDKLDYNNYQSISLLSNISKILEKIMHIYLTNMFPLIKIRFFQVFEINIPQTIPSLVSLKLSNQYLTMISLHDLQKAFDTEEYKILQSKMNHYGIKGIPYEWFESYLTNRQKFAVNKKQFELSSIEFGKTKAEY